MTTACKSLRVLTKHRCHECYKGKIPHGLADTMYDSSYCPACQGTGWMERWVSLYELNKALNMVNALEQTEK